MPARSHLLRQLHVVRRLQAVRGRSLPFAELRRYLLHESNVSDFEANYTLRTFQRDKQEISDLFGLTIRHRWCQGYYLAEAELSPWPSTTTYSKPWSCRSSCGCRWRWGSTCIPKRAGL